MPPSYTQLVESQREFYRAGKTFDLAGRRRRIEAFRRLVLDHKREIDDAIYADLHRRDRSDVDFVERAVDDLLAHLDAWTQPREVPVKPGGLGRADPASDSLFIVPEPLGVVLVIGPSNVPLIALTPLAHAFAAGNTVIVKPSELVPTFSTLFAQLIRENFDDRELAVVEGGVPEITELLKERFDHILYTGCPAVARVIMAAAATHLTPVTLELGGKNPVVFDESAIDHLTTLSQQLVYAKSFNAGQTCICPDYILTTPAMKPRVVEAVGRAFGNLGDMSLVPTVGRIVNDRHFLRLESLLKNTKGTVLYKAQGEINRADKFIPFHLIEVKADDAFMQEEIFGPVICIMTVDSFDEALDYIKTHEKPLAAYLFTSNDDQAKRFAFETSSGGVTVNSLYGHAFAPGVPFGGVGESGMGRVHGKYGFDAFCHEKTVMYRAGIRPSLELFMD